MTHRALKAAVLTTLALAAGCVQRPKAPQTSKPEAGIPIARQTLDQIQPKADLPAPATRPSEPASLEALQRYAAARDALLQNRKKEAADKLAAVIELDDSSPIVHRDLGYALLGVDNDRAQSAFHRAIELDPQDVDSRIQLSRLLANKQDNAAAILQMRQARHSDLYKRGGASAIVVDVLLAHLLSQAGYTTAALECYERVLPALETLPRGLTTLPELAELAAQPARLKLRIADLSAEAGQHQRAIDLYEQIGREEPSADAGMKLRIARTFASKGDLDAAASRVLALVDQFDASRPSVQAYLDLFEPYGGDEAALEKLDKNPTDGDQTDRNVLRAQLHRRGQRYAAALKAIDMPGNRPTFAYVRALVHALQDAGRRDEAPLRLMQLMNVSPRAWPNIERGWIILSQPLQPSPLDLPALQKLQVPDELEAARQFSITRLAVGRGQPVVAKRALTAAAAKDAGRTQLWLMRQQFELTPDVDVANDRDLALYIDDFSDDPELLRDCVELALKQNQKQRMINALHGALQRRPSNLGALVQLVSLLTRDDQKVEALRVIEQGAANVRSGGELYQLSALATQAGDPEGAERLLRRAHGADPLHPSVCNDLGYLLADTGRELEFAEELLNRAVAAEPENPAFVDSLGWLLYKRQKFPQASQYLEQAIEASDPVDPVVLDHAADAAYRTDQKPKAQAHWEKALEALQHRDSPDRQLRLKVDQKLRQLKAGQKVDVAPAGDK